MRQKMNRKGTVGPKQTAPILPFSWEMIEDVTHILAQRIQADGVPDVLVSLQRGGLIPAVLLSHQLAVAEMITVPICRTTSDAVYADKQAPVLILPEHIGTITGKDVVMVDDIAGSGETMRAAFSALVAFRPRRLRAAMYLVNLNHWEQAQRQPAEQAITYIGQTIRAWAVFPWERQAVSGVAQEQPGA